MYNARETVFSDQPGKLPKRSQQGNKYLMVMVRIDSNSSFVAPLTSRKDPDLTRAYKSMVLLMKQAGMGPKKHILNNNVSEAMKDVIREKYNIEMELVPPESHCRNVVKLAIRNHKTHVSTVLAGTASKLPPLLLGGLLP